MHGPEDTGRRHGRGERDERPRPARDPAKRREPEPEPMDEEPMFVFTAAQSREVDRLCTEEFGIPSLLLMEHASMGVADVVLEFLEDVADPGVLVFCGPGNNGGDGLAVARHLANEGCAVSVVISAKPGAYTGDARTNLEIVRRMGIPVACAEPSAAGADEEARAELGDPDLVIDALFGTGLDRRPEGAAAELIGLVNGYRARGATIMSVDVPSGLDADTGLPVGGEAVRADLTVSLLGLKPGYMTLGAQEFVGDCLVVGIGAPSGLIERLGRPAGGPHPGDHAGGLAAEWTDAPAGLTGSEDAGGEPTRPG